MKSKLLRKVRKKIYMSERNKTYIVRRYECWFLIDWYSFKTTKDKRLANFYLRREIIRYATYLHGFRPKNKTK